MDSKYVTVSFIDNVPFVWNRRDWRNLREAGVVVNPLEGSHGRRFAAINPVEAIASADGPLSFQQDCCSSLLAAKPDEETVITAEAQRCACFEKQQVLLADIRYKRILATTDKITKGKRKQRSKNSKPIDKSKLKLEFENAGLESKDVPNNVAIQIHAADPWTDIGVTTAKPDSAIRYLQQPRCLVYNRLRDMGWIVSEGGKYGVDFVCYLGDPLRFHAQILIKILDFNESITLSKLIRMGRLANGIRKTLVLASCQCSKSLVKFQSFRYIARSNVIHSLKS